MKLQRQELSYATSNWHGIHFKSSQLPKLGRPALSALLNQRVDLSPELALRLEKTFGVSMGTLMRMQNSYDIAKARACAGEIKVLPFNALVL